MGEKSDSISLTIAQYSDTCMFTSYHCTIRLVPVHKFIATTYKHNSWHIHMNFYLLEDDVYFTIYLLKLFIASDVLPTLHVYINSKNNKLGFCCTLLIARILRSQIIHTQKIANFVFLIMHNRNHVMKSQKPPKCMF